MRITSRGQVTIPVDIRRKAGLEPHTDVEVSFDGTSVVLKRAADAPKRPGQTLVAHILGRGDVAVTTDEIMAATREV